MNNARIKELIAKFKGDGRMSFEETSELLELLITDRGRDEKYTLILPGGYKVRLVKRHGGKMKQRQLTPKQEEAMMEAKKEPIYWFATLERARADGDIEVAALAIHELRNLGIDVRDRRNKVGE